MQRFGRKRQLFQQQQRQQQQGLLLLIPQLLQLLLLWLTVCATGTYGARGATAGRTAGLPGAAAATTANDLWRFWWGDQVSTEAAAVADVHACMLMHMP
jgi:hypothetical protein